MSAPCDTLAIDLSCEEDMLLVTIHMGDDPINHMMERKVWGKEKTFSIKSSEV